MVALTRLSENELNGYYKDGLIGTEEGGAARFSAQDAGDIGLIRTLKGFGMTSEKISQYFDCLHGGALYEAADILRELRKKLLDDIHEGQASLDTVSSALRNTEYKEKCREIRTPVRREIIS